MVLVIPTIDETLGALFVGFIVTTGLYGITLVQTFLYVTSPYSAKDRKPLKIFVGCLFLLDTLHQIFNAIAMYTILIKDFANPLALIRTPGFWTLNFETITATIIAFIVQSFFALRVFKLSASLRPVLRWGLFIIMMSLALLTLSADILITIEGWTGAGEGGVIEGFNKKFALSWRLGLASAITCDVFITTALVTILYTSRTGSKRGDGILKFLIIFFINTALVTTLLTIAALIVYLVKPAALYYAGIHWVIAKCYVNSALATLNARSYTRKRMVASETVKSMTQPQFAVPTSQSQAYSVDTASEDLSDQDQSDHPAVSRSSLSKI